MAARMKLRNVTFHGHQDSLPYYERATIVSFTSDFGGWGMALTEGMQMGCIPVSFDSYLAVRDIIVPGKTREIVPPYDEEAYALTLKALMGNENKRKQMAENAFNHVRRYDIQKIAGQWDELFHSLRNSHLYNETSVLNHIQR